MFRKLVSNLPFSPALVGQLGFYARRLRKEEMTRRMGLILTALALIVQSFTVFVPSTSANTSNPSDLISGGVDSIAELLQTYDNPNSDYKKIMDYVGVTRSEIKAMAKSTVNSREFGIGDLSWLSWGRVSRLSAAQGEVKHTFDGTTVYSRPLWRYDSTEWTIAHGSTYTAFVGTSAAMGKFAIVLDCGNILTRRVPVIKDTWTPITPIVQNVTVCRPGVGIITIKVTEKKATDLPADSIECKPKEAACTNLVIEKIDRTKYNFKASASVTNGATVKAYVFTVRSGGTSGAIVTTKTVATTALTAQTGTIELKNVGTYYVSVTVQTSLGDKTSSNCASTFAVAPLDKCEVNPSLPKNDPACKPCPGNPQLWINSPECTPVTVENKSASNLTQGLGNAASATAVASDRIEYKLTITNPGKVPANASFKEELGDVLEYATMQDTGGGVFDKAAATLAWPTVTLAAGEKQTRTFVVSLMSTIPSTARGTSEPSSFDCIMNNTFGDNIQIPVKCDTPKIVEQTVSELPATGPRENMIFAVGVLVVVTYFWARSRQLGKEVRLVRKDFSGSTL